MMDADWRGRDSSKEKSPTRQRRFARTMFFSNYWPDPHRRSAARSQIFARRGSSKPAQV
jgi:hypothetical protein